MLTTIGYLAIYVGALNSLLATTAETCTMGAADSLIGGIYSVAFYACGIACLWVARPGKLLFLVLLPVVPLVFLHVTFSIRLAGGVWLDGLSACSVMKGMAYMHDGRESFFASLWLVVSVTILLGLPAAFFRRQ